MQKKELYLSLGSNIGNRKESILKALCALEDYLSTTSVCSRLLEFPSWGFCSSDFLNCVVRFDIPGSGADARLFLMAVLCRIKEIEKEFGRDGKIELRADGTRVYRDRPIDIDILFYDDEKIESDTLTIPHPLAGVRNFVLEPLKDVATPRLKETYPFYF